MADDPSDPLRNVLEKREAELAAARREIARKDQIIAALQQRLFGSKSERYHPDQEELDFGEEVLGKFEPSSSTPENEGDGAAGARATGPERRSKRDLLPRCLRVVVEEKFVNPDNRRFYARAIVREQNGRYLASLTGPQGSGILTSMALANALVIVPEDVKHLEAGMEADALMLGPVRTS